MRQPLLGTRGRPTKSGIQDDSVRITLKSVFFRSVSIFGLSTSESNLTHHFKLTREEPQTKKQTGGPSGKHLPQVISQQAVPQPKPTARCSFFKKGLRPKRHIPSCGSKLSGPSQRSSGEEGSQISRATSPSTQMVILELGRSTASVKACQ